MLVVVSPAKKLNMKPINKFTKTQPVFSNNVNELVNIARDLTVDDIQKLMDISPKLAELNRERFQDFGKQEKKAAAFTFAGDTYKGLDIETMSSDDIEWAQKHLRILSGLYGLLRPLDSIEPYRLEMGSKLKGVHGSSLYEYWDDKITKNLNKYGKDVNAEILVNCASNEYFNAIKSNILSLRVITPIFMERKEGKEKIVSFYAKNARGVMARYIIQNRLLDPQDLKQFNLNGYNYIAEKSDENKFTFIR
jgi:cytoplasmic iron level regulating protein YaaA (DUF328/UPF0246 family)